MVKDMVGMRFAKLVVVREAGRGSIGQARWKCRCDCGNEIVTDGTSIRAGRTKSCGCLTRFAGEKRLRNGEQRSASYRIWTGMKSRCTNPNNKKYHLYGGKGIAVCERWSDFRNFFADMGERPIGMSLDRIDGNKGYGPDNCRWATPKMQANNMAVNRVLTVDGVSKTVAQWAEATGIKANTIIYRLRRGWSAQDAVSRKISNNWLLARTAPLDTAWMRRKP